MAQQIKVLADNMSWSLEPTWWEVKTGAYKLTFDHHKPTMEPWCVPLAPHKISGGGGRVREHFEGQEAERIGRLKGEKRGGS